MKFDILKVFIVFMLFSFGSLAYNLNPIYPETSAFPPRGPLVETRAGNCDIGPFGQIGDVGEYEGLCSKLTSAEKCLAYLKQHIGVQGQVFQAQDLSKATFCLKSVLGKIAK